jgi:hypothetical protein
MAILANLTDIDYDELGLPSTKDIHMNITGSHKIVVKAPIKDVFEKFNDPNMQREWVVQPYALRDYTPPLEKGCTYTVTGKFMRKPSEFTYEVVEFNLPTKLVLKLKGSGTGLITIIFKEIKDGTEVDFGFNRDFTAWLTSYTALDIHNALYNITEADFNSFKAFIEG